MSTACPRDLLPQHNLNSKFKKRGVTRHLFLYLESIMEYTDPARKARFDRLCREAMRTRPLSDDSGIGTLGEKRMHAIIKRYLCEDEAYHEQTVPGTRFVSDIRIGTDAYEVQTGAFYPMKKKIEYYLSSTDYTVTVVHPIPAVRWMSWVDPVTMEIAPRKRVTRSGRAEDLLPELYSLLSCLPNERLHFHQLFLETHDFRLLNGRTKNRKVKASHYERIPLSLLGEAEFHSPEDFRTFVPEELPERFTARDFATLTRLRGIDSYSAIRVLAALGLLTPTEKIGRSMAWEKTKAPSDQ